MRCDVLPLLLPRDLAGVLLFDDLGANSAAVDDHLAPVDRGFRRKRERIGNIEGPVGGLVEYLVDLNVHRSTDCLKPALNRPEGNC